MKKRKIIAAGLAAFLGGALWLTGNLWINKLKEKNKYPFLPKKANYIQATYNVLERQSQGKDIDIMFLYTDHFEPQATPEKRKKFRMWIDRYPQIAKKYIDSDGHHPKHTFFFLPREPQVEQLENLLSLNNLTYEGLGGVEIHLHHGTPDSEEKNTKIFIHEINQRKKLYSKGGALITAEENPQIIFGFIHGNWALDNSWQDGIHHYCGINRELELLTRLGCYADFTFPTPGPSNPRRQLSIFYSKDDPGPKSYDKPENLRDVVVGGKSWGDPLHIEGPRNDCFGDTSSTAGVIGESQMLRPEYYKKRIFNWISNKPYPEYNSSPKNVHVKGRPEWIFIKLYCHGVNFDITDKVPPSIFFWEAAEVFYSTLESMFKNKTLPNGAKIRLHYVTAREAYNIIKAAEAGMSGNAGQYRDFLIPKRANLVIWSNSPYLLQNYTRKKVFFKINPYQAKNPLEMRFKEFAPDSKIYESEDGKAWTGSDAERFIGDYQELCMRDHTVSKHYKVEKIPD